VRLDEVHLEPAAGVKDDKFDGALADRRYGEEFRAAGLAVDGLTPEEAAERIRMTPVVVELATALDNWARYRRAARGEEDAGWRHLLEVARRVDPDEFRCRVRDALAVKDRQALEALAQAPDVAALPAASLAALGNVLCDLGAPNQAVEMLRAAQRRHPTDFWINHGLGWAFEHAKPPQLEEAIRFYTVAVALRPHSPGTWLNFGNSLYHKGRLDEAIAAYQEAIRLKPDYAMAHNNLGNPLLNQGKLDEAIIAYQAAIRFQPDFAMAHDNLGSALRKQGKLDEAIAVYQEAIRLKSDYFLFNLGVTLAKQGKLDAAIAAYREAIRLQPGNAYAHNNLGFTLAKQGKLDAAIAAYREAIRLQPVFATAHRNLGTGLAIQGKWDDACTAFQEAIRIKTKSLQLRNGGDSNDFFFLAMAHWQLGEKEKARTWYDQAVEWMDKNRPRDEELRRFRAEAAELLGIPEAAAERKDKN
jgi:tetratricopeptide (TPR) repeat protein